LEFACNRSYLDASQSKNVFAGAWDGRNVGLLAALVQAHFGGVAGPLQQLRRW